MKANGIYYSEKHGRIVEHNKYSVRIFWNKTMLDYLKNNYATTLNKDLAEWLGVSQSTMSRKASELGLQKDEKWLVGIWNERRELAQIMSRIKGYPGGFQKGVRSNPKGEFKPGHKEDAETKEKRKKALRQWCLRHPDIVRKRAKKAGESRKKRKDESNEAL